VSNNIGVKIEPACQMGFTRNQVTELMGDQLPEFNQWMRGQTISICDGRLYNYATEQYDSSCGVPHGPVFYPHDVQRFLEGQPVVD
jgi:hypothetical protein